MFTSLAIESFLLQFMLSSAYKYGNYSRSKSNPPELLMAEETKMGVSEASVSFCSVMFQIAPKCMKSL